MAREGKLRVEIERVIGKSDEFKKVVNETQKFYDTYNSKSLSVEAPNFNLTLQGLKQIHDEYEKINKLESKNSGQVDYAHNLEKILGTAKEFFSQTKAIFSDGSFAIGFDDIIDKFSKGYAATLVDLGERAQHLKNQIHDVVKAIDKVGGIRPDWRGGVSGFDDGDMSNTDIQNRILLLQDLIKWQKELENFNGADFTRDNSPTGISTKQLERDVQGLKRMQSELEEYNSQVERQYQITTEQLRRRKNLIAEAEGGMYWGSYDQDEAKKNIKDDEYYEQSIRDLRQYISEKEDLIAQLRDSESELFRIDGVDQYIPAVQEQIAKYRDFINELEILRNNDGKGTPISGDLSEVVNQLKKIKNAINDIKTAFEPLTNALSSEDSAIHKMLTSSIDDLNTLESKLGEVYQMIDTISNKQFNVQNIISNGNSTQNDLEQIRQFRKEAKELYKQVEELYSVESMDTFNALKGKPGGLEAFLEYQQSMAEFDLSDLAKRIKSRSAVSLGVVIDELNEWKKVLLQFNNLRNNVEAGSFNVSKYSDTSSKVSVGSKTTDKEEKEIVDDNTVDNNDILNKIKSLSEQVEAELTSIRSKMEETFNFDTLDLKSEGLQSVIEAIYQQFVELQTKINALDLNLNIPTIVAQVDEKDAKKTVVQATDDDSVSASTNKIDAEAQAMQDVATEATQAAQAKEKFANANKEVASSTTNTNSDLQKEQEEFNETAVAAERAAGQIEDAFNKIDKSFKGNQITINGTSYADFEKFALDLASSNNMKIDDVSVIADGDDKVKLATVKMVNEELAQSVVYTYRLQDAEDGVTTALLERYKASSNVNKALKMQLAAEKKAAAEQLKADKKRAKNNEWLIKQQSKLDTQERRYKHSNKSVDGSTTLMSTETSLEGVVDDADKTIDTLAKHIRDRIQSAVGGQLTSELKEQILNDIRILQNEIAVAQSNKYSATNMKASNVETNKKAYTEYLNAFEANAKKANVFEQMKDDLDDLRTELNAVNDSAGLDAFIDNLKIARNKLAAEKAKYAQESQESKSNEKAYNNILKSQEKYYNLKKKMVNLDPQSAKGQETLRKLTKAQKEYNAALAEQNKLTVGQRESVRTAKQQQEAELGTLQQEHKSKISTEQEEKDLKYVLSLYKEYTDAAISLKKMQSDTDVTGAVHTDKQASAIKAVQEAKENLLALGIDVNKISESGLLTEKQINALLEEQIKYKKQIQNIEDTANDKAATKENKQAQRENKQNQNYGKVIYNREARYFDRIGAETRNLEDEMGLSGDFVAKIEKYKAAFKELKDLRDQFANNPDAFNDAGLRNQFQDSALGVEKLRKEILATFKESQKLALISDKSLLGQGTFDASKFENARAAMIDFAATVTNGQFKLEGFNSTGTEMHGVIDRGAGVIEKVTVSLDEATGALYAYQNGTRQATNSWNQLGDSLKNGVKHLVSMYFGFHEAVQAVRKGLTYVKEIDLALTELKKVTDATDETYSRFLKNASATASVIGSTISDFTDATAAFARLGYSIEESSKMAETAIVYKNVADGLDTVEESTESIISTMKAYGIEADDTMGIIDRFNAVGNNFAITSAGIGEALQRSASALYAGGNTIDESIALVTGANSVIQNPEQVGTALKTLSLRIRGVKTE